MNFLKPKILFITPSKQIGGAERSLLNLLEITSDVAKPIVALRKDSRLFDILKDKDNLYLIDLIRLRKNDGFFKFCSALFLVVKKVYVLYKYVKANDIDLIYSNTNQAHVYSLILNCLTRKKIIWHVRDNLKNRLFAIISSLFSYKIICVSDHIYQQLPYKKNAEIICNGIDTRIWKPDSLLLFKLKDKLGIDRETVLIGHVGQLIPWKRHDLFIDVAVKLIHQTNANIHFVIIGDDLLDEYAAYKEKLILSIEKEELGKSFSFLSYQSNFLEYLNGIDILAHFADDEPFGRVVIEAMALKKPVIARAAGGPKEIVIDDKSGYLITDLNPKRIAEKLKLLVDNPGLRYSFGTVGRHIVEKKFSIKNLQKVNVIISKMNEKYPH